LGQFPSFPLLATCLGEATHIYQVELRTCRSCNLRLRLNYAMHTHNLNRVVVDSLMCAECRLIVAVATASASSQASVCTLTINDVCLTLASRVHVYCAFSDLTRNRSRFATTTNPPAFAWNLPNCVFIEQCCERYFYDIKVAFYTILYCCKFSKNRLSIMQHNLYLFSGSYFLHFASHIVGTSVCFLFSPKF